MNKKFERSYRLFLDDIREPKDTASYMKREDYGRYFLFNWVVVRNYDEFKEYIIKNGIPRCISFDHDLALEHYTPEEYWGDYDKSKEYQESLCYTEKTGQDCAIWLCEHLDGKRLPLWYIHSQNPVGANNIKSVLNSYKKTYATQNI